MCSSNSTPGWKWTTWQMSTVTPETSGSQRETRVCCHLSIFQDTLISL